MMEHCFHRLSCLRSLCIYYYSFHDIFFVCRQILMFLYCPDTISSLMVIDSFTRLPLANNKAIIPITNKRNSLLAKYSVISGKEYPVGDIDRYRMLQINRIEENERKL